MAKWEENEYIIEAKRDILETKEEMAEAQQIFSDHIDEVASINPTLAAWAKSGYEMDVYWDNQSIENNMEYIASTKRAYENRVAGAKRAAETKKIKKAQTA